MEAFKGISQTSRTVEGVSQGGQTPGQMSPVSGASLAIGVLEAVLVTEQCMLGTEVFT